MAETPDNTPAPFASTLRGAWDVALSEYRMREALFRADDRFGALRKAIDAWDEFALLCERQYGSVAGARLDTNAQLEVERRWQMLQSAEETSVLEFDRPLDQAAIALALTPAPNLEAALFKIEMIEERGLQNWSHMPRDCMEIVKEDMARLAA